MTTYSGVIGRKEVAAVKIGEYSFYKLNIVLSLLSVLFAVAYVFLANFLVAQKYSVSLSRRELGVLNTKTASQNLIAEDLKFLLLFAQKSGMVEAKEVDSIMQDRNFALTPLN